MRKEMAAIDRGDTRGRKSEMVSSGYAGSAPRLAS